MKPMTWTAFVIVLVSASLPALAQADEQRALPASVRYQFEEQLVKGDLLRPEGETLAARGRGTRQSLVEVRTSYVAELLASVEDL